MNKFYFTIFFVLFVFFIIFLSSRSPYVYFSELPVLHDGRIKPIETLAKSTFSKFLLKTNNFYYSEYIAEIVFNFDSFSKKSVFKIKNYKLLNNINIRSNKNNLYSFNEIFDGLLKNIELINSLLLRSYNDLTFFEQNLMELYYIINTILSIKDNFRVVSDKVNNINIPDTNYKSDDYIYVIHLDEEKWIGFKEALSLENNNMLNLFVQFGINYNEGNLNNFIE